MQNRKKIISINQDNFMKVCKRLRKAIMHSDLEYFIINKNLFKGLKFHFEVKKYEKQK